jgi:hypothetical protein
MRYLVIGLLVAYVVPIQAADKDDDKAKEAVAGFLKASRTRTLRPR